MEMDGKVVVVTGASMGIGEAIAQVFVDHGAGVVLLSRDASRAEAARHRVGHTDRTLALACDVRTRDEIDNVVTQTLGRYGRIDVWVNNAGVGIRDSVADMEPTACRELFDTNLFGATACMQAVVPAMRHGGGGTIINISSVAGHIPVPFMTPYCASLSILTIMRAVGCESRASFSQPVRSATRLSPVTGCSTLFPPLL